MRPEVERAMEELRGLMRRGVRSVGVVTPFRAQADALEEAALGSFDVDELEALDLRIGTVHALIGIGASSSPRARARRRARHGASWRIRTSSPFS